ncbi:prepilin peptidase [Helicobacter sp. 11S02629-2]|uniref:prepilin peptidase n=1 Tax=Helicobacter sp. 11S02629-2 TaxID=1476195 RepID=UPI00117B495B|nr:prepilin peptidase [Helicobacter sp. 11S02629-2]
MYILYIGVSFIMVSLATKYYHSLLDSKPSLFTYVLNALVCIVFFDLFGHSLALYALFCLFYVLFVFDYKFLLVPSVLTYTVFILALSYSYIESGLSTLYLPLAILAAGLLLKVLFEQVLQRKLLGSADIVVMASLMSLLSLQSFFYALIIASLLGLASFLLPCFRAKKKAPFISALFVSTLMVF